MKLTKELRSRTVTQSGHTDNDGLLLVGTEVEICGGGAAQSPPGGSSPAALPAGPLVYFWATDANGMRSREVANADEFSEATKER